MVKFDDGVTIDTSGPLHCLTLDDGMYVVGEGVCIPVKDEEADAAGQSHLNRGVPKF